MHPKQLIARLFLALLLLPALAWAAPAVEGRDYVLIEGGAPWQPLQGKIEVVEVFDYRCDHCARFVAPLDAWQRKQSKDVRVSYVPLPRGNQDAFSRGFFATQAAGALDKVHAPLFAAVHQQGSLPANASIDELSTWYGEQGLDTAKLRSAMDAPELAERLTAARQFATRSGVEGTPTLIINGRYRILGTSFETILQNADAVITQLRGAQR